MFILKIVKVLCFDTLLQVFILKVVSASMNLGPVDDKSHGCRCKGWRMPVASCFAELADAEFGKFWSGAEEL